MPYVDDDKKPAFDRAKYFPTPKKIETVKEKLLKLSHLRDFPPTEVAFEVMAKAYARFASVEPREREDFGTVVPIDWLIDEIAATCERFPMPIKARRLYRTRFTPDDHEAGNELSGVYLSEQALED